MPVAVSKHHKKKTPIKPDRFKKRLFEMSEELAKMPEQAMASNFTTFQEAK